MSARVWLSTRYPGDPGAEISPATMHELPATKPTVLAGLFYILPLFVLVWCLMVLEQSPGLAAFYACTFMAVMLVTQRPLLAYFRGQLAAPAPCAAASTTCTRASSWAAATCSASRSPPRRPASSSAP